jgi:hypothetical protein
LPFDEWDVAFRDVSPVERFSRSLESFSQDFLSLFLLISGEI